MNITKKKLEDYFGKFGELEDCVIIRDKDTTKPRGFGFITFTNKIPVKLILKEKHVLLGKEIECKKALPKENAPPPEKPLKNIYNPNRIFIGGIPKKTTEIELRGYFSRFGKIEECLMIMNKNSKRYRGFGFVTFETYGAVDLVFKDYYNHYIKGAWIECKASFPKNFSGDGVELGFGQIGCIDGQCGDQFLDKIYDDCDDDCFMTSMDLDCCKNINEMSQGFSQNHSSKLNILEGECNRNQEIVKGNTHMDVPFSNNHRQTFKFMNESDLNYFTQIQNQNYPAVNDRKMSLPILTSSFKNQKENMNISNGEKDIFPIFGTSWKEFSANNAQANQEQPQIPKKYSENLNSIFADNTKDSNSHYLHFSREDDILFNHKCSILSESDNDIENEDLNNIEYKDGSQSLVKSFKERLEKSRSQSGTEMTWNAILGYQSTITPLPVLHKKSD